MFSVENAVVIPNIDHFFGSKGRRLQDLDASGQTDIALVKLQAFLQRFLGKSSLRLGILHGDVEFFSIIYIYIDR